MEDALVKTLERLPKQNLINILLESLDHMQLNNNRSKIECICTTMGIEGVDDNNDGNYSFDLSDVEAIKKATDRQYL